MELIINNETAGAILANKGELSPDWDEIIGNITEAQKAERQAAYKAAYTPFDFERKLSDTPPLVDEADDPTVLFKHNWLARGQAIQLTASSGVGKSSFTIQMAFNWAAGKPFLAEPIRPMKVAIIQAEDSDRDVAEQIQGMRTGLIAQGWTSEEFDEVCSRILCPKCFIGKQGEEFIEMLREFQATTRCDMIFVNPVQSFFGGDIGNQKDVSAWARGGIDPIIKTIGKGCGFCAVTHTTKFTSGNKEGRANVDDYGEYIGAGSHEWLDWVRAKFVFLKHGKSERYFDFKAAKRGARLGWVDATGEPTTKKIFKHSEGFIFWEEVTDQAELESINSEDPKRGAPRIECNIERAAHVCAPILAREFGFTSTDPLCKRKLYGAAYALMNTKGGKATKAHAAMMVDLIFDRPEDFGVMVVDHPTFSGKTLAPGDDF